MKISIQPQWVLDGRSELDPVMRRLLPLLAAVEREGNLQRAARELGFSYRLAWGIAREGERALGAPVLKMSRGRGSRLTPLGETLLWAEKRVAARLAPMIRNVASELEFEIERALREAPVVFRLRASHGFAIELLRDHLAHEHVPIELKYCGSMDALASLAAGDCEIGGFHAPVGPLQREALAFYAKWLRAEGLTLVMLCARRQGIITAPGNPKAIGSLADLARPGMRFVNRQFGSGTRLLLDLLLAREGIESSEIAGYPSGEFTHSAVAACVASGMADAGFGVEHAARRFGLEFIPVANERYFLVCRDAALKDPFVKQLLETLKSRRFRAAAAKIAGIDASHAGTITAMDDAFPELREMLAEPARER
ncbi:MAG TPA: substrate-binding domain-containing protein [Usitatibacter sp.]|nr:substrate-binding domain-containing protein [Usitatibacter sp.]